MSALTQTIENKVIQERITISQTVLQGTSYQTASIDLTELFGTNGKYGLQVVITGDGTATIEYLISADNVNFINPSTASEIATGLTKASGSGTDGKDYFSFTTPLAKYIKIKITETTTTDDVIVNAILLTQ